MGKKITIFTDGAARGNPGPGGYGVVLQTDRHKKELSEGYKLTTNNRMELLAVIVGLEALRFKGSEVVIYTDSKYIADAVNKGWVLEWERKAFRKKKNADLWKRFLKVYRQHDVTIKWVEGHSGIQGNERCDRLAVEASEKRELLEDKGYLEENAGGKLFDKEKL
ncbi:MAG: ribonuclease HI [Bacteroidales bacterium]|jgi:ribonuclease HI|nr:ribonuclease HI [Bacteroidales bacterium]